MSVPNKNNNWLPDKMSIPNKNNNWLPDKMSIPNKKDNWLPDKGVNSKQKDELDTQALQERNQDAIRNKNQRITSLNEEFIELKEDKTHDNDDSSEQQERLK